MSSGFLRLSLAFCFATSLAAEPASFLAEKDATVLEPGSKALRVRELEEHEAAYTLYSGEGEARQELQTIRRRLEHVIEDGERRLRFTWTTTAMGREVVDRLDVDAKTLAPRMRSMPMPSGGEVLVRIDGARVRGEVLGLEEAGEPEPSAINATFERPLCEASPALLSSLRYSKGKQYRFASLPLGLLSGAPASSEIVWTTLEAERKEHVVSSDGRRTATWVVRIETSEQPVVQRVWVARRPPYLLRKEIDVPGMGRITWELEPTD